MWKQSSSAIDLIAALLGTRRGTLLMETGLLHDYLGNFSSRGEKYYFCVKGACDMRLNLHEMRLKWTSKQTSQLGGGGFRWWGQTREEGRVQGLGARGSGPHLGREEAGPDGGGGLEGVKVRWGRTNGTRWVSGGAWARQGARGQTGANRGPGEAGPDGGREVGARWHRGRGGSRGQMRV